jgi:hypothetical protein
MAKSPAHTFGQIIGDLVEAAVAPMLNTFAKKHGLYLDRHGKREARNTRKVTWKDAHGNAHDLDFVLERGGTEKITGTPVAFIETAWRRYTKHSRNKAQEIQGAILPLVEAYHKAAPFAGIILAGVFTHGAIEQLRSSGFAVLYFDHSTVVSAFKAVGIDAAFDEATPDAEFQRKVSAWEALEPSARCDVGCKLIMANQTAIREFMSQLGRAVTRRVDSVRVLPLHGAAHALTSVTDAIRFVAGYAVNQGPQPLVRFEIEIVYNNGDRICGQFQDKQAAVAFLRNYETS